jgi:hypothetical protein
VPRTHAERQAAYRRRLADRIAAFHARESALESALESAAAEARTTIERQAAEIASLRREIDGLYATLAQASAASRDAGPRTECAHPAGAVDGGTCRACGAEVW